jgi:GNAT superfamily N-acetyltransferase
MEAGYTIRLARAEEVDSLPAIELAAAGLFNDLAEELELGPLSLESVTQVEDFEQGCKAGSLWVAADSDDRPVGFALVQEIDGLAFLVELDVHPAHGRRGLGSALLATVCKWARRAGFAAVTLSTFRDVPWNGPFYARRGFRALDEGALSPGLLGIRERERKRGLRTDLRVIMRYETGVG